jgi:superfamily II DNA helicase RecQ
LEGFYQESGRAGRDGQQAESVLFFSEEDHRLFRFLAEKKNKYENAALKANAIQLLEEVVQFATRKQCRRQQILGYFGQQFFSSQCAGTCDVCDKSLQFFRSEPIGFVLSQTQAKSTCTNTRSVSTHPLKNSLRRSYDLIGTKYQPSETVTLVVDGHEKKKVLAGEGFVAVNGSSDNGTYDAYMSSKKFFVGHKRGRENIDSTLDALERAEKREQEQSIRISSSKSSRSRLADKLL